MPTIAPKPQQYDSIQQYLEALKFTINKDYYVCGEIVFPCVEICGHTVATFADKMRRKGWVPAETDFYVKWPAGI